MESLQAIKKLRQNANEIYDLFNRKIPLWKTDPKHYDKTGWGFNKDDRFTACTPVSIWFSSHKGTYGDSSCSRQLSLDAGIFNTHLVKYLNENKESIMMAIAKSIEDQAKTLKQNAEEELNRELSKLAELT